MEKVGPERMRIYVAIEKERKRQDAQHGATNQTNGPAEWCTILAEEFGEAAKEACELTFRPCRDVARKLRTELVEVAAVAVAWAERIESEHLLVASEGLMRAVVLALENALWDGIPAARHGRVVEVVKAAAERGITVPPAIESALLLPADDAATDLAVGRLQILVDLYDQTGGSPPPGAEGLVVAFAEAGEKMARDEIPPEGFPEGYESLCQAAAAARGVFDGSTFQTVPPAGPPCTAEGVLAGAEVLRAIDDLGPPSGRVEPPIFSGPVSDVALAGCIDLFRELVRRIDRSDSDSGWITKVGHWEWMASALEELRRRRRIDDEAELRRIEQIMANFPHPRPLPPPPASTNERLAALLKQISGDPDRAGPGLPDAKTATQQDEAEARQPSSAPSSGLLQALIGMQEQDADDPGSIAKVDTRAEAEVLSAMMQGGAIVLDVGFSGDWSAGLRAWQDTVLISCKSADFGGDPGEFAEAFRSFMAEWYDGAMVLVRGGPEQERIHEPDPPADDDGRTDSCSPETFN